MRLKPTFVIDIFLFSAVLFRCAISSIPRGSHGTAGNKPRHLSALAIIDGDLAMILPRYFWKPSSIRLIEPARARLGWNYNIGIKVCAYIGRAGSATAQHYNSTLQFVLENNMTVSLLY